MDLSDSPRPHARGMRPCRTGDTGGGQARVALCALAAAALAGCTAASALTPLQRMLAEGRYRQVVDTVPPQAVRDSGRYRDMLEVDIARVRVLGTQARPLLCEDVLARYPDSPAAAVQGCRMLLRNLDGQHNDDAAFARLDQLLDRGRAGDRLLRRELQDLDAGLPR